MWLVSCRLLAKVAQLEAHASGSHCCFESLSRPTEVDDFRTLILVAIEDKCRLRWGLL